MSFFHPLIAEPQQQLGAVQSNVMGATGLSRAALAGLFRDSGLFGRESSLAPVEQAIVRSQIGRVPGLPEQPVLAPTDPRLAALQRFTGLVIANGGLVSERDERQLVEAGFTRAAASEAVRVVRLVRDVYGLQPHIQAPDARLGQVPQVRRAVAA